MGSDREQRRSLWSALGAWLYDPLLALGERRGMAALRRELLRAAQGRVLEVGAGTGRNLAAYPSQLDLLVLSEPDPSMLAILQRRVERTGRDARFVTAGADALPFPDAPESTLELLRATHSLGEPVLPVLGRRSPTRRPAEPLHRQLQAGGGQRAIAAGRLPVQIAARFAVGARVLWGTSGRRSTAATRVERSASSLEPVMPTPISIATSVVAAVPRVEVVSAAR